MIKRALRQAEREMRQVAGVPANIEMAQERAVAAITDLLGERLHRIRVEWSSAEGH